MILFSIVATLFATDAFGFSRSTHARRMPAPVKSARRRPARWSNLVIALTVVYCFLLLAGLTYTGWFRLA